MTPIVLGGSGVRFRQGIVSVEMRRIDKRGESNWVRPLTFVVNNDII